MRLVLRSVVLFLVVLLGLVGSSSSLLSQVVSSNATVKEVEFAAEDNVFLKGTYGVPENGQAKHPAIIFVHERGGDRRRSQAMGFIHGCLLSARIRRVGLRCARAGREHQQLSGPPG
ncbi:hypothetical protein HYR54_06365 [Candidatus Acetothermia bacterium]|nr:hypothetical protein [Candidatus Acetothermia bacterium]